MIVPTPSMIAPAAAAVPAEAPPPDAGVAMANPLEPATSVAIVSVPEANTPDIASTPTPVVELPTETPSPLPTATATEVPTETSTPTPSPTLTSTPQSWAFAGVRLQLDEDRLLLYGNVINNTGASQELWAIAGLLQDEQGQVIADLANSYSYWPGHVLPAGGVLPFELTVEGINQASNYDLTVEAEPSEETPHQAFELSDLESEQEGDAYCVAGELRNRGGELNDYLTVALILYDGQDNVVSFSDYEEFAPDWIKGDDTLEFELCAESFGQPIARHEIQAWGR